jgi:hypothetical protein
MSEFTLVRSYLGENIIRENADDYFNRFLYSNVIVNVRSSNISFIKKKCGLSIKCAFNGREIYETDYGQYSIDDNCYLILNREQSYSGYINSHSTVESFSLFFEKEMVNDVIGYLCSQNLEELLEFSPASSVQPITFYEKTYLHDKILSPCLLKLRRYIGNGGTDSMYIEEQFHRILSLMFRVHKNVISEIKNLPYKNQATKIDLFKKLNRAKDYMDCFFS